MLNSTGHGYYCKFKEINIKINKINVQNILFFFNFTLLSNLNLLFFNFEQNLPCTSEKYDDAKIQAVQDVHRSTTTHYQ